MSQQNPFLWVVTVSSISSNIRMQTEGMNSRSGLHSIKESYFNYGFLLVRWNQFESELP